MYGMEANEGVDMSMTEASSCAVYDWATGSLTWCQHGEPYVVQTPEGFVAKMYDSTYRLDRPLDEAMLFADDARATAWADAHGLSAGRYDPSADEYAEGDYSIMLSSVARSMRDGEVPS